jgi:hypothetical protein
LDNLLRYLLGIAGFTARTGNKQAQLDVSIAIIKLFLGHVRTLQIIMRDIHKGSIARWHGPYYSRDVREIGDTQILTVNQCLRIIGVLIYSLAQERHGPTAISTFDFVGSLLL